MQGNRKFSPGDLVRIREWDDMKKQFGTNHSEIMCRFGFVEGMRYLCGTQFVIGSIDLNGNVIPTEENLFEDKQCYKGRWSVSTDMIELVHDDFDESDEEFSAEDYLSVIRSR